MSSKTLYRLAAILLIAGGLAAGIAHIIHPPSPPGDPASLLHYAHASRPAHLLLFAGVMLVLFGLPAHFLGQRRPAGLLGLAGVDSLVSGMLFADVLHCVLEFSVFPVLIQQVPCATPMPGIVESTYSDTPLGVPQGLGQVLVFIGMPLTALDIWRSRVYRAWTAEAVSTGLALRTRHAKGFGVNCVRAGSVRVLDPWSWRELVWKKREFWCRYVPFRSNAGSRDARVPVLREADPH